MSFYISNITVQSSSFTYTPPTISGYTSVLSGNTNTITISGTNFTPTNNTIYYGSETISNITSSNNISLLLVI